MFNIFTLSYTNEFWRKCEKISTKQTISYDPAPPLRVSWPWALPTLIRRGERPTSTVAVKVTSEDNWRNSFQVSTSGMNDPGATQNPPPATQMRHYPAQDPLTSKTEVAVEQKEEGRQLE